MTVTAGVTYVYDGRGRMKQAGSTTYLVNGLGQRVKKSGGSDTYFAYDEAGHLIGEYDSTGAAIQETLWLGDTPVAVVKPATPSGFTAYYIWTDNLGTPRQISDTSNQSRWEWANSDPFGNNAPNENPAGVGAFNYNLRFPGQYFDSETGKHYNYFRDYDPGIGRYMQSDPVGLWGGLSTYSYVMSNPLKHFDIWGLAQDRHCQYFGYVSHPGTEHRFEEVEQEMRWLMVPLIDWSAPHCSWHKLLPPGKLGGITPPCKPETYWEDWTLVGHWKVQFDQAYEDQDHIYICDPECSKDDGIRHQWIRVPKGGWQRVASDFLYADWERGANSKR